MTNLHEEGSTPEEIIDRLSDEFERAWRDRESPRIKDYLPRVAEDLRARLFKELFLVELAWRRRSAEETVPWTVFFQRFPEYKDVLDVLSQEFSSGQIEGPDGHHDPSNAGSDSATVLLPNVRWLHFDIYEEVGKGSYGVVHRAWDRNLQRIVALKRPRSPEFAQQMREMFQHEARASARLVHPNIVRIYDMQTEGPEPYIVMNHVEGTNLKYVLLSKKYSPKEAARFVAQMANAVQAAHTVSGDESDLTSKKIIPVIHRDLKPANVLVGPDGEPHILDFGLARHDDDELLSGTGQLIGSPSYMSPEQVNRKPADERSDIYALGVVLYEMLAGAVPFSGPNTTNRIRHEAPAPLRAKNAAVPRDLDSICLKCLAKSPDERYQSARDLELDLKRFVEHFPLLGFPRSRTDVVRKFVYRNRRLILFSLVLVFSVSLVAAYVTRQLIPEQLTETFPVKIETVPPGCELTVVKIDPDTGEPDLTKLMRPPGRTPLTVKMEPGEHLIVAVLDETRFHEVYRYIPQADETIPMSPQRFWNRDRHGAVSVNPIVISRPDVAVGMGFVEEVASLEMPAAERAGYTSECRLPAFYVDSQELTFRGLKNCRGGTLFDDFDAEEKVSTTYRLAQYYAELLGKRLPNAGEMYYLTRVLCPPHAQESDDQSSSNICRLPDGTKLAQLHSGLEEWTSTCLGGPFSGVPPVRSAMGLVGRHLVGGGTVSSRNSQLTGIDVPENASSPGGGRAGIRLVRSSKPRRKPEDFMRTAK